MLSSAKQAQHMWCVLLRFSVEQRDLRSCLRFAASRAAGMAVHIAIGQKQIHCSTRVLVTVASQTDVYIDRTSALYLLLVVFSRIHCQLCLCDFCEDVSPHVSQSTSLSKTMSILAN
jgi:hypothetical protein